MGYWLRFAVVDKKDLDSPTIVKPQQMLELYSCSRSFIAALMGGYDELEPVTGTEVPPNFHLEDQEESKGMHADPYGTLHFYTPAEILEARERALPFYSPPSQDEEMFDAIRALPDNMVLIRILLY